MNEAPNIWRCILFDSIMIMKYYIIIYEMKCVNCGKTLIGRQKKYCCRLCKNTFNNINYQSYRAQQRRGLSRKLELLRNKGGACEKCGYDINYAALEFHHKKASEKRFQLDLRSLSNRRWEVISEEAGKCILLCSNCHAELHHPDCLL